MGSYRYGFNGQEKDDEIKGSGNSYTATFWEYDPRIGRRWNVDPIIHSWISPYSTFFNNPVCNTDYNGADPTDRANEYAKKNKLSDFTISRSKNGEVNLSWESGVVIHGKHFANNRWKKFKGWTGKAVDNTATFISGQVVPRVGGY